MSAARKQDSSPKAADLPMVTADTLIPLSLAKKTLGLGEWALRTARARGLKVTRIGNRRFILGSDLLAFVRAEQERQHPQTAAAAVAGN